jgi:hypothetical protein
MNRLVAAGLVGLVIIFGVTMSLNAYASYQEHMAHLAQFHAEATASAQEAAGYATAQAIATAGAQETEDTDATWTAGERAEETATATARSAEATAEAGKPLYVELCVDTGSSSGPCPHPQEDATVRLEQVTSGTALVLGGGDATVGDGKVSLDTWKMEPDGSRYHVPCHDGFVCVSPSFPTVTDDINRFNDTCQIQLGYIVATVDGEEGSAIMPGTYVIDVTIGEHKLPPYTLTIVQ